MPLVLLAVDETEESQSAARTARELFGPDATYLAVNVADDPAMALGPVGWGGVYPYAPPYPAVDATALAEAGDDAQDRARSTARMVAAGAGVAAAPVGKVGDAAEAIAQAAHEHGADVIVVGSSDKSWWRRVVDGSVSRDLLRHAPCPVLVVHRADT